MARENSIQLGAYNRLLTYFLALLCDYKKAFDSVWHVGCYELIWDGPKTDHIDKKQFTVRHSWKC